MRVARLTGVPDALGLPGPDAARAAAGSAVEDAWGRLVQRELPAAAEHSLLRYVHWLLDLPVYALAVWVLYLVARGFIEGTYVGFDFLVNAALILAAYLFAVRFVVRRGLAWRARRLLADVILRTRRSLGTQADAARTAVQHASEAQPPPSRLSSLESNWRAVLESESPTYSWSAGDSIGSLRRLPHDDALLAGVDHEHIAVAGNRDADRTDETAGRGMAEADDEAAVGRELLHPIIARVDHVDVAIAIDCDTSRRHELQRRVAPVPPTASGSRPSG